MFPGMNTAGYLPGPASSPRPETAAEAQRRIGREATGIAEARAQLEAGQFVAAEDIDAWVDSIGTDQKLPPPPATGQR